MEALKTMMETLREHGWPVILFAIAAPLPAMLLPSRRPGSHKAQRFMMFAAGATVFIALLFIYSESQQFMRAARQHPHSSVLAALSTPTSVELQDAAAPSSDPTWWKHAVIYEIYPRSFQDSNGDGIGDLNGITQRLDYLQQLGVDAIWIAPMYVSPQVDFGYDISNYTAVDPQYGTLADFDRLLAAAQAHHIRVLLDMVLNHTSDKAAWFAQSASSRTNPRADWYVWNDGKPEPEQPASSTGKPNHAPNAHLGPLGWVVPPNNWISTFGGSAWEWVPARQQFYYHNFYKQQPDLNWRNPAVEKAMFDVMRFWLNRGVAGFRLDAIPELFEDPQLRDEPVTRPGTNPQGDPFLDDVYTDNLPEVHDVVRRMRAMVDTYSPGTYPNQRLLIGETYLPNTAALLKWYGDSAKPELQLPMDMLLGFNWNHPGQLDISAFRGYISEAETELNGEHPLFVFDNHDNARSMDRFANPQSPQSNGAIARILATILYTTRSTALTYYGAEIGMTTHVPTRRQDVRDPIGITGWPREKGRDGERTPMQWTPSPPSAGFSTNPHPWLPIGADYPTVNVRTETADPGSLLNWNRTLIAARAHNPTLHDGGFVMLDPTNPSVLSYARTALAGSNGQPGGHPIVVSLNFTAQPQTVHLDLATLTPAGITTTNARALLTDASSLQSIATLTTFTLPPYATLVAEIQ
jgi:alpha-glucosidase